MIGDGHHIRIQDCEKLIHKISEDSAHILITDHAKERMELRDFTYDDLLYVLRTGHVTEAKKGKAHNEVKCKIIKRLRGSRDAGAVTAIKSGKKLIIITMEWEDL